MTVAPGAPTADVMTALADLGSLVEVASEATVSRTVLTAEGARLVLFSFDAGQELTEHAAAMPVLLQVLDGRMSVAAAGRSVDLVPGASSTCRLASRTRCSPASRAGCC